MRRGCVHEDALDAVIVLFRSFISQHLVPSCNQTAHMQVETQNDATDVTPSHPSKKRRVSGELSNGILQSVMKKVYRHVLGCCNTFCVVMERLQQVVESLPLEDHQVLTITNGALSTLEMEFSLAKSEREFHKLQQIQLASTDILSIAFRQYPSHRDSIMEDIFPALLKLPTSKRTSRTFIVPYASASSPSALATFNHDMLATLMTHISQPHTIQIATALIISMVQACVQRPYYNGVDASKTGESTLVSGLSSCKAVANSFISHLLNRCLRVKDGAAEFRPILVNLIEDLLVVLMIPQYPAAEFMVLSFVRNLHPILLAMNSQSSSPSAPDGTVLTVAFDILGKVCSVQAKILAAHQCRPIAVGRQGRLSSLNDNNIQTDCHCGKHCDDSFLVNCDQCHIYYHGTCVGIASDKVPDEWYCDSCRLLQIAHNLKRQWFDALIDYDEIDDVHVLRYAFIASLSHRVGNADIDVAMKYHIASWMDFVDGESLRNPRLSASMSRINSNLMLQWGNRRLAGEHFSEEGGLRLMLAVMGRTSPLLTCFRQQLAVLLNLMSENSLSTLRKLSLKVIEKVSLSV
jgi:cohesin loading factor subunit SCC2